MCTGLMKHTNSSNKPAQSSTMHDIDRFLTKTHEKKAY